MLRSLVAALLFALISANVHAATFQVTRLDDPWPNGCLAGDCSLREAMVAAAENDPAGPTDTILLPTGTITLTLSDLNVVDQRLRVQGAGSSLTRVVQTQEFTDTFHTTAGADLVVVGMSLDSFRAPVNGCYAGSQGVPLFIEDVVFEGGSLQACGTTQVRHSELLTSLYVNGGQTVVEDSTIRDLVQQGGMSSTLTLRRVLIDGLLDPDNPNETEVALINGALVIEDSTITNIDVRAGGNPASTLAMRRVHYIDNAGPVRTDTAITVTIEDSLFEDNTVRAVYASGGAEWTISGSSFVNNRVDGNAGGAIVLEDDTTLRIRNSTFSGNSFTVEAAADGARGAAIGFRNGTGAQLILTHVTLVRPNTMPVGIVGTVIGGHGNGVTLTLSNSIVRGTCGMNTSVLFNNAGNIESVGDTCGLDPETNRINVSVASLALGSLANNGGPTPTHLPATGSLAIDRASTPQCLPTDQRGYARPGGVRCDVGALEADGDDTLFADGFES